MKQSTFAKFVNACVVEEALTGWICLIVSVTLMIAGFCLPPVGVIDNTVIVAAGELLGFYTISKLPAMIRSVKDGKSISVRHGDTEVSVASSKKDED